MGGRKRLSPSEARLAACAKDWRVLVDFEGLAKPFLAALDAPMIALDEDKRDELRHGVVDVLDALCVAAFASDDVLLRLLRVAAASVVSQHESLLADLVKPRPADAPRAMREALDAIREDGLGLNDAKAIAKGCARAAWLEGLAEMRAPTTRVKEATEALLKSRARTLEAKVEVAFGVLLNRKVRLGNKGLVRDRVGRLRERARVAKAVASLSKSVESSKHELSENVLAAAVILVARDALRMPRDINAMKLLVPRASKEIRRATSATDAVKAIFRLVGYKQGFATTPATPLHEPN